MELPSKGIARGAVVLLNISHPPLEFRLVMSLELSDPGVRANTTAAGAGTGTIGTGAGAGAGTKITGGIVAMLSNLFRRGYR